MYTMHTALLPQKVCDELDRMNRHFFWGSTDDKGKVHLIGWHHITKSRLRGGLGIRSERRCKIAMLGKLDWALNRKALGDFVAGEFPLVRPLAGSNSFRASIAALKYLTCYRKTINFVRNCNIYIRKKVA